MSYPFRVVLETSTHTITNALSYLNVLTQERARVLEAWKRESEAQVKRIDKRIFEQESTRELTRHLHGHKKQTLPPADVESMRRRASLKKTQRRSRLANVMAQLGLR